LANETARRLHTPSAYQAYLNGNTLKQHANEAKQQLQALEKLEAERATDKKAWQTARQQHTSSAYQAYLNGSTLKHYANRAKQQLQALEKAEAERAADKKAWQTACQQHTQSAYQAYLNGNTLKQYADEAQKQLQALEKAEAERAAAADKKAWQTARQQHTPSAYQAYLKGGTIKQYADEAQKQLQALEQETKKGLLFDDCIILNRRGEVTNRKRHQAKYQTIDLGNGVTLEMVFIPGGTFLMGSPKNEGSDYEKPQHRVTIEPFYMGKYPVTQRQWQAVMGNNPSYYKGENRPVENISWHEAVEFFQRLSKITGIQFHLPSEAQWEYACRAGTTTPFYFGETMTTDFANYDGNYTYASEPKGIYRGQTTDVGSFPPNAFGLYDMHGNVWEWCADVWHSNYKGAPTDGSAWEIEKKGILAKLFKGGEDRLFRGGSFGNGPKVCRTAPRGGFSSDYRVDRIGVRAVVAAWL
jgi:formylglycine-generating enzyme required for sulfatase activity